MTTLLTNCVAAWKFDETSGNAADSVGANTLTAARAPGSATGRIGNARICVAASPSYFQIADNAAVSVGAVDWSACGWVKFTTLTGFHGILCKSDSGGGGMDYEIRYSNASNCFQFATTHDGSTYVTLSDTSLGVPAVTGTWYFWYAQHDSTRHKIGISINDGTLVEMDVNAAGLFNSANPLAIGNRPNDGAIALNGMVDQTAMWKRLLTAAERTQQYNGGNGLAAFDSPVGTSRIGISIGIGV